MYEGIEEDRRLILAVPHPRQVAYQELEFMCFAHFTVNTYTGREWGLGDEPESIFNPAKMDAGQWAAAAKAGGMRGIILTCKHHDGFCLWPSRYTEHSVKNSPYKGGKGDIVREVSDACRANGLKFGVYLSPWDRSCPLYGQGKPYDDYYVNQLEELLTDYGEVCVVWLDGACGEGPNGKVQRYDWERYFETVRRLQPNACIFGCGPDIRWCGNEAGKTRPSEWSVVPADMASAERVADRSQKEDDRKFRERGIDSTLMDLGSRQKLKNEPNLIFYPAETDFSIRPGWFYHPEEDDRVRSFENLKDIYLKTVGGNANMLLNIPPTPEGLFHETDVKTLAALGSFIRGAFAENLAETAHFASFPPVDKNGSTIENVRLENYDTYFENPEGERELTVRLRWEEVQKLEYLVLKEQIFFSQRVESFTVSYLNADGSETEYESCTVIGHKRIVALNGLRTKELIVRITDARVAPVLSFLGVY